jgi:hypothetical protein
MRYGPYDPRSRGPELQGPILAGSKSVSTRTTPSEGFVPVENANAWNHEAEGGSGGVGSLGAFFGSVFVSRALGRFICPHSSASSARRVQVRSSRRISRIRALGACSAICWHSAARSLHLFGLSIVTQLGGSLPFSKIKPRLDRGGPAGFFCARRLDGAKLSS